MFVTANDWLALMEQIKNANNVLVANDKHIYELVTKLMEDSKQKDAKIAELQSTMAELLLLK